jgi:hypothetical protein
LAEALPDLPPLQTEAEETAAAVVAAALVVVVVVLVVAVLVVVVARAALFDGLLLLSGLTALALPLSGLLRGLWLLRLCRCDTTRRWDPHCQAAPPAPREATPW